MPTCPRCGSPDTRSLLYNPAAENEPFRCRPCGHLFSPFRPVKAAALLRSLAPEQLHALCESLSPA